MLDTPTTRPSVHDGQYPRPQLHRAGWASLDGAWGFQLDDLDAGRRERWFEPARTFAATIAVPYPPESPRSGIADTGHHRVLWYRRTVTPDDLRRAGWHGTGSALLHLGAVDYRAEVWADGMLLGTHEGGHTPFTLDVTAAASTGAPFDVVVRVEDDPLDLEQPRGKQDWQEHPHSVWYHRTSGIWQPVWLETVPAWHVRALAWTSDVHAGTVRLDLDTSRRPEPGAAVRVVIRDEHRTLGSATHAIAGPRASATVALDGLDNGQGYEHMLWSPEHPRLLDATVELLDADGGVVDHVGSYLGLRTVGVEGGRLLLNDRPYPVRAVLAQNYWPESHLAAPSADALRDEVQLIKDLGFTTARVHQKIEDPRFLYWADRLGLLVWAEMPSAYAYSPTSVARITSEWIDVVARDRSHPSVVAWVPMNESWGVQHAAHDPRPRDFIRSLFHLTKALDDTRLVISNDGWEHADSDLLTVHDYEGDADVLAASYADADAIRSTLDGVGPAGRRMRLLPAAESPALAVAPVVLSEFGGIQYAPTADIPTWGYSEARTADEFEQRLRAIVTAAAASPALAGYCYTQLTDTVQEANGLVDQHRRPKLPIETIRAIVLGEEPARPDARPAEDAA
ncbi:MULTISPECIES: sugar-binding domain-containing protein [unclassified Agrococcus]|uniref:sugar-binding domain-containing protein n=1 Tax=unclassified Agrococcus TaxID=2615065 RepID=UPI00360A5851